MRRHRRLLLATALAGLLAAATGATGSAAERAAPGATIVFASDRATANPGEIYALGAGRAARNVTHSPYADVALATSPRGRAFAFWSNRAGPWRLMIAPDGRALRSVVVGGSAGADFPPAPPVFSADGTRLLIPYLGLDSIAQRVEYAVAGVRSGPARTLTGDCSAPALSPDGQLIACTDGRSGGGRRPRRGRALHRPGHRRALVARRRAGRRGGEEHRGSERIWPLDRPRSGRGPRLVARREDARARPPRRADPDPPGRRRSPSRRVPGRQRNAVLGRVHARWEHHRVGGRARRAADGSGRRRAGTAVRRPAVRESGRRMGATPSRS